MSHINEVELPNVETLPPSAPGIWTNPLFSYVNGMYQHVSNRRSSLGLPNPGTLENFNREVSRDVFLTPYFFSGLRADVSKSFSLTPAAFQVSHALSLGSPVLPTYAFAAAYATDTTLLQGTVESDRSLSGRMTYGWNPSHISKAQMQLGDAQNVIQLEHDYLGPDCSINFKAMNPNIATGGVSGVFTGSLFQSLTSRLALGVEAVYSATAPSEISPPQAAMVYTGRYVTPNWIASAQLQPPGTILASFWRKVADKVEAGLETTIGLNQQAMMLGGGLALEGTTTAAAKYEFRQSIFRGQIDSKGRVSCLIERRVLPVVSVLFAGELDQVKSEARVGLGLQLEAGSDEVFQQQQQMMMEQQQQQA